MDILNEIGSLVYIAFLGFLFNLFVCAELESYERFKPRTINTMFFLLLVAELVAGHSMFQYQLAKNETQRHTAYSITIPVGKVCKGRYYSGKNKPITVICLDGRKFVAQSIQVTDTVFYNPDSITH